MFIPTTETAHWSIVLDYDDARKRFEDCQRYYWLMTFEVCTKSFLGATFWLRTALINCPHCFPPNDLLMEAVAAQGIKGLKKRKDGSYTFFLNYRMIFPMTKAQYLAYQSRA